MNAAPTTPPSPMTLNAAVIGSSALLPVILGGCTLYNADCLDVLPGLTYDVLATDPPYKINHGSKAGVNGGGEKWNKRKFTQTMRRRLKAIESMSNFAPEQFFAAIQSAEWRAGYFFCNKELVAEYIAFSKTLRAAFNLLVWKKENVGPMQFQNYLPDIEYIIYISRKGRVWNHTNGHRNYSRVIETPAPRDKLHPAEKPVLVMQRLILNSTTETSVVCDPYMGGGTTAIACIRTGRKFIGVEKDAGHFQTALERIRQELAQGVML